MHDYSYAEARRRKVLLLKELVDRREYLVDDVLLARALVDAWRPAERVFTPSV